MTNFLTDPITTPTTPLLRRRGLHIMEEIKVFVADERHIKYVDTILDTIERAAKIRGTGIAKRSPEYVKQKMLERKAIIALDGDKFAGFWYIDDTYRGHGLAKRIKRKAFELSRERFPEAKIFGLTTGEAVMKINNELGYRPVAFASLTDDPAFWKGCESCVNFDILQRNNRRMCLCTGMLYDPHEHENKDNQELK